MADVVVAHERILAVIGRPCRLGDEVPDPLLDAFRDRR
jgi:hypothetical protein